MQLQYHSVIAAFTAVSFGCCLQSAPDKPTDSNKLLCLQQSATEKPQNGNNFKLQGAKRAFVCCVKCQWHFTEALPPCANTWDKTACKSVRMVGAVLLLGGDKSIEKINCLIVGGIAILTKTWTQAMMTRYSFHQPWAILMVNRSSLRYWFQSSNSDGVAVTLKWCQCALGWRR